MGNANASDLDSSTRCGFESYSSCSVIKHKQSVKGQLGVLESNIPRACTLENEMQLLLCAKDEATQQAKPTWCVYFVKVSTPRLRSLSCGTSYLQDLPVHILHQVTRPLDSRSQRNLSVCH